MRLTKRTANENLPFLVNVKENEQRVEGSYNTLMCIKDSWEKLARYEETGLEPEGVHRIISLANKLAKEPKETCEWVEDDSGTWSCSKCEASWEFNNGGPSDNDMHYCPKCGREIATINKFEGEED